MTKEELRKSLWCWTTIPFFPEPHDATLVTIAELLEPLALLRDHVEQLKRAVLTRNDKWQGYATLLAIANEITQNKVMAVWQPAYSRVMEVACKDCGGFGTIFENGTYRRCQCVEGQAVEQGLLDSLNARTPAATCSKKQELTRVTNSDLKVM